MWQFSLFLIKPYQGNQTSDLSQALEAIRPEYPALINFCLPIATGETLLFLWSQSSVSNTDTLIMAIAEYGDVLAEYTGLQDEQPDYKVFIFIARVPTEDSTAIGALIDAVSDICADQKLLLHHETVGEFHTFVIRGSHLSMPLVAMIQKSVQPILVNNQIGQVCYFAYLEEEK